MPPNPQIAKDFFDSHKSEIKDHLRKVQFVKDVKCFISRDRQAYLSIVLSNQYDEDRFDDTVAEIEAALQAYDVYRHGNHSHNLDDIFMSVIVARTYDTPWKYTKLRWIEGLEDPSSEYGGDTLYREEL